MRTIGWLVAFLVVVALAVAAPALAGHAATPAPVTALDGIVRSYGAVSAEVAWALTGEALLLTDDGGATWRPVTPPELPLHGPVAAVFFDAATGWLATTAARPGVIPGPTTTTGRQHLAGRAHQLLSPAADGRFDPPDLEKSKARVAESGVATPIDVRIGYRAGNQRRTETVAAIQSACKDAGFNIIDSADPDFFTKANVTGDYEIALYAGAASGPVS